MMESNFISIFKGVDLAKRKIPMITHRSQSPGPVVWVIAAIHGDEVTGTETVLRLNRFLKRKSLLKGTVYSLPIMNPMGYELISRQEPIGATDLNRCFPGQADGNTAERIAFKIFSTITETKPDLVIDLHTDTMESIPYLYLDQVIEAKNADLVKEILKYAEVTGINYFVENKDDYYNESFDHTITGSLINKARIPSFTAELGGPLLVREKFVEIGLNVVKNCLQFLGMIEPKAQPLIYTHKIPLKGIWETVWHQYSASYSGIVEYKVQPGDMVKPGQVMARIKNLFDKTVQIIKANEESVVISYPDQSVCFPGTELFMVARRNDQAFQFLK